MRRLPVILILGSLLVTSTSRASTFYFGTAPGTVVGGVPVSADVIFGVTTNFITVTLENLQDNPTSVIQNINALGFQITGTSLTQPVLQSSSAAEVSVVGTVVPTYYPASDTGWQMASSGNSSAWNVSLYVLGTPIGPKHTLMGGPNPVTGHYDNANGGIKGAAHNPFLLEQAVYVLYVPGVLPDYSTISGVVFSFGTTAGSDVTGVAPEPSTSVLLGCGAALILVGARMRKASRKKS